jgi:hypothetical protein
MSYLTPFIVFSVLSITPALATDLTGDLDRVQ